MICGVHALIGAALGKLLKDKKRAFWAGVVSHLVADLMPHRDLSLYQEALIVSAALAAIGAGRGWDSPEFWGALGCTLPDVENGIAQARGLSKGVFPSHAGLHGPKVNELVSQAGVALICLAILLTPEQEEKCRSHQATAESRG